MARKKVLIVLGSPRKKGNSAALADQAKKGAEECGASVETLFLQGMKISPCTACDACQKSPAAGCVIEDDMEPVYDKLRKADAIVIASPVYWFNMSAQTKLFMDRCYALGGGDGHALKGKRVGILLTYADSDPFSSGAVNAIRTFQDAFRYIGAEITGILYGSASIAGEIRSNRDLMKKARELGKELCRRKGGKTH